MTKRGVVSLALALLAPGTGASAQEATELPPLPKVGTVFHLRTAAEQNGKALYDYDQTATVTAVGDGTYVDEIRTAVPDPTDIGKVTIESSTSTLDRNPLVGTRQQKVETGGLATSGVARIETTWLKQPAMFPLTVGKTWSSARRSDSYMRDGRKVEGSVYEETCTVGAAEHLTVAARGYDVLPIACDGRTLGATDHIVMYYAPEVARIVRTVTSTVIGQIERRTTFELRGVDEPPG